MPKPYIDNFPTQSDIKEYFKENNMIIKHETGETKPPSGGSNVNKICDHTYKYLGQRRVKDEYSKTTSMTKLVDVFYCEKCLKYKTLDII